VKLVFGLDGRSSSPSFVHGGVALKLDFRFLEIGILTTLFLQRNDIIAH